VELYIDLGDLDENKALFDRLAKSRESSETEFGEKLEWERLDEKRASRVATYRQGSIEDDVATLEEIQAWMIERLFKFKAVFGPKLS